MHMFEHTPSLSVTDHLTLSEWLLDTNSERGLEILDFLTKDDNTTKRSLFSRYKLTKIGSPNKAQVVYRKAYKKAEGF